MSDGNMNDQPLSDVTARQPATVQKAPTRGKSRSVNKFAMILILLCHVTMVAFTVYIVVLCCLNSYSLFLWHPALSTIGGFLLMAEAVLFMSPDDPFTGRLARNTRVKLHWIVQALAALISLAGLIVVVVNKEKFNASHFKSYHAIFGLVGVVLVVATCFGGITPLYSNKLKRFIRPVFLKLIHNLCGILAIIFSVISLIYSLYTRWILFQEYYSDTVKYVCFVLICLSTLITIQNSVRSTFSKIIQLF